MSDLGDYYTPVDMQSPVPYRLTQAGLAWFIKNRQLNRQRTSTQKYARVMWEVALGRLGNGPATAQMLYEPFVVGAAFFDEREVAAQLGLLLEMEYITTCAAPELDGIAAARAEREARIVRQCGRNWKRRTDELRKLDDEIHAALFNWFRKHPDWPVSAASGVAAAVTDSRIREILERCSFLERGAEEEQYFLSRTRRYITQCPASAADPIGWKFVLRMLETCFECSEEPRQWIARGELLKVMRGAIILGTGNAFEPPAEILNHWIDSAKDAGWVEQTIGDETVYPGSPLPFQVKFGPQARRGLYCN